ncbi:MAG: hypothetical protein V2B20_08900 [Pseudomonadota bacterium]
MKKLIAATCILGFLIIIFLVILNLQPSLAPKRLNLSEPSAQLSERKAEPIVDHIDTPQDTATSSSTPDVAIFSTPPTEERNPLIITAEELTTPLKDSAPNPEDHTLLQPKTELIGKPSDTEATSVSVNQPIQGLGLLTDTDETEENQILDPQSTQVQATFSRKSPKKAKGPWLEQTIERAGDMEIAILPEAAYPFSILLETFDQKSNAQQAITQYRQQLGIATFWTKVDLGLSGVKHRLFTGTFPTEAVARTFLARNHLIGKVIKKASYAAEVGVFQDKKELAAIFAKTREAGAFPYILGTASGQFHLFVGAFYTAAGAENQCRELMEKTIPCKAILRSTLLRKN